jgi:hypothetical protein
VEDEVLEPRRVNTLRLEYVAIIRFNILEQLAFGIEPNGGDWAVHLFSSKLSKLVLVVA